MNSCCFERSVLYPAERLKELVAEVRSWRIDRELDEALVETGVNLSDRRHLTRFMNRGAVLSTLGTLSHARGVTEDSIVLCLRDGTSLRAKELTDDQLRKVLGITYFVVVGFG